MRGILSACAVFCGFLSMPEAEASVRINIDLSSQTMHVRSESGSYDWPVSTARSGYRTPRGTYRPSALLRMHYSHKYHMSPMPHSIFFAGGYAIHGTYETRWLGRPASHGCIRLAPGNAAQLFQMVKAEGALITITGRRHTQPMRGCTGSGATPLPGTRITILLPTHRRGVRQLCEPGRQIPSSSRFRNGLTGRDQGAITGQGNRKRSRYRRAQTMRREMAQKRRLFCDPIGRDRIALFPDRIKHLDDIVEMTLCIDTARKSKTDELSRGRDFLLRCRASGGRT